MSKIQRILTLATILLVALLAAVAATAAEHVSVNGVPVGPGANMVRLGDAITIENDTPGDLRVRTPEGTVVLKPWTTRTFTVEVVGATPFTVAGRGGRWTFEVHQGNAPPRKR